MNHQPNAALRALRQQIEANELTLARLRADVERRRTTMLPSKQFMGTKAYFNLTPGEKAVLKAEAQDLHGLIDNPKTEWVQRERATARLGEVNRLLQSDAMDKRRREQVGDVGNQDRAARLVRSDDGGSFLLVNGHLDDLVR